MGFDTEVPRLLNYTAPQFYLQAYTDNLVTSTILISYNLYLVEVEVNLRPTDSRSVCLGVRRPSETCDKFFFLLEISIRHLQLCYFVAPSLTRGRVCTLLCYCFWVLPKRSLLGRSLAELTTIFYCLIWNSLNLEGQVPVFTSPRNRVAKLYPRALCLYHLSWKPTMQALLKVESKRFWVWCLSLRITGFLHFAHRPEF
jgi:hypothetical protein